MKENSGMHNIDQSPDLSNKFGCTLPESLRLPRRQVHQARCGSLEQAAATWARYETSVPQAAARIESCQVVSETAILTLVTSANWTCESIAKCIK